MDIENLEPALRGSLEKVRLIILLCTSIEVDIYLLFLILIVKESVNRLIICWDFVFNFPLN